MPIRQFSLELASLAHVAEYSRNHTPILLVEGYTSISLSNVSVSGVGSASNSSAKISFRR